MTIPVVWIGGRKLCWDQHTLDGWLSSSSLYEHHDEIPSDARGCVLVIPARYHAPDDVNALIAPLEWVLLVLTSDEESTFDCTRISHPNMRMWVMTPYPERHAQTRRNLVEGIDENTSRDLLPHDPLHRPTDVFFAGQVNHIRRTKCANAIRGLPKDVSAKLVETPSFTEGLPRDLYLQALAASKIAPCPAGRDTPDSFRLSEALEAGCIPIVDDRTRDNMYPRGYWPLVFGEPPPFPIINNWSELEKYVRALLDDWLWQSVRVQGWWLLRKWQWRQQLRRDALELSGTPDSSAPDEAITVVIPTSPIPSHPSTHIIDETIASIRERLPAAEIIITCDGIRAEQADRRNAYHQYLKRLLWKCAHEWTHVVPIIFDEHVHQGGMARAALEHVDTPCILYVEHDTPITGDIDFEGCVRAVRSGRANVIRYHFEAQIPGPHVHLMLDREPVDVDGVPMIRTIQWSQRPHLASTGFYRTMIATYFGRKSRTMIEDVMHGVVYSSAKRRRTAGWEQFRVWIYHPEGSIVRSRNLDGRETDLKYDMIYAYDTDVKPSGAPAPTEVPE